MPAILILIALGGAWCVWTALGDQRCPVERIVDADTVIACGAAIRIRGVDAPESLAMNAGCEAEVDLGLAYAAEVREMLSGQTVTLVDPVPATGDPPWWSPRVEAGVMTDRGDLGTWLLQRGYAVPWPSEGGEWCG